MPAGRKSMGGATAAKAAALLAASKNSSFVVPKLKKSAAAGVGGITSAAPPASAEKTAAKPPKSPLAPADENAMEAAPAARAVKPAPKPAASKAVTKPARKANEAAPEQAIACRSALKRRERRKTVHFDDMLFFPDSPGDMLHSAAKGSSAKQQREGEGAPPDPVPFAGVESTPSPAAAPVQAPHALQEGPPTAVKELLAMADQMLPSAEPSPEGKPEDDATLHDKLKDVSAAGRSRAPRAREARASLGRTGHSFTLTRCAPSRPATERFRPPPSHHLARRSPALALTRSVRRGAARATTIACR